MDFGASKFNIFWLILLFGVINLEYAVCYKCEYKKHISGYYACNIIPDSSIIEEKHVNGKIDDNIEGITFYGNVNGVSHITQSELAPICHRFKNLIDIFVYEVNSVDENLFQQCRNLGAVQIINSEIDEIPEDLFVENLKLTRVVINDNKLRTLPENIFINQKELGWLDLDKNQISCLPSNIFKSLVNLSLLSLIRNKLQSLNPKWFENLQFLNSLWLSDNKIQDLPKNIFVRLENLRELNLHDNQLTTIHADSFGIHKRLFRVDLNLNKINAIDEKLLEDTTVSSLLMYGNVCSKENIEGRIKIKEKLSTCFKNYRPREEQNGSIELCIDKSVRPTQTTKFIQPTQTTATTKFVRPTQPTTTTKFIWPTEATTTTTKFVRPTQPTTTTKFIRPTPPTTTTKFVRPTQPTTTTIKCGTRVNSIKGLIHGGTFTDRGEYPWNVALIRSSGDVFCGGTLVSDTHVVTAAHCIKGKGDIYEFGVRDITVMLGVHNHKKTKEFGRISAKIKSIHVHKYWNTDVIHFDGDIAILELANEVQFSNYIRPICLADDESEVAEVSTGTVVGFGLNENGTISDIANKLDISITDYHSCISNSPDHQTFASARTFCGGPADGRGVCDGDSGSGVYVLYNEIFYLRGLVSASLVNNKRQCDTHQQAVFTDITQYYRWIKRGGLKRKQGRTKRFSFV